MPPAFEVVVELVVEVDDPVIEVTSLPHATSTAARERRSARILCGDGARGMPAWFIAKTHASSPTSVPGRANSGPRAPTRNAWQREAMTLQHAGDGPSARCVGCGAQAVGPCARCHAPVCGDCCVLTQGSAKTWAICLRCDKRAGRSLSGGWWQVALWIAGPLLALALAVGLLELLSP